MMGSGMKKQIVMVLIGAAVVLLVPLVAMQVSNNVQWSVYDFITMGALLLLAGFAYVFGMSRLRAPRARIIWALSVVIVFLLIWVELAVGWLGTPFAGN